MTLATQVEQRFRDEWAEGLRGNIQLLLEQLRAVMIEGNPEAQAMIERMLAKEQEKQRDVTDSVTGVAVGLTAALFLVNPFLALAGTEATLLYALYQDTRARNEQVERDQQMREAVHKWRDEMVNQSVRGNFYATLLEQNNKVVEESTRQFANRHEIWPIEPMGLRELQQEFRQLKARLAVLVPSRMGQ